MLQSLKTLLHWRHFKPKLPPKTCLVVRFRVIKHTSIIQNLPLKLSKRMGYLDMFQKLFLFFVFTKLFASNESKTILTTTGILSLDFFRNPGFPKV